MNWLKKYRKWKQRDFIVWRDDLSDYERNLFLPEIKGRCEALLTYCREIDTYCKDRSNEHNLGVTLRNLGLNGLDETRIPVQDRPPGPKELARSFFSDIQDVNQRTFISPIENILKKFKSEITLKEFGEILTEVNLLCSIVIQVKDKLFLYRLNSIAFVRDTRTGQVISTEPRELTVLLLQFKNAIDNIYEVANSTSASISQWHKEQIQWKTEFLQVVSERIAQRNNLLTIIVAVAVSWAFLTATQPLEKFQLGRENETLKSQMIENLNQNQLLNDKVKTLNLKIEELNQALSEQKKESGEVTK